MLRSGNGKAQTCSSNLLKLNRGEVFYSRLKGISPKAIDKPTTEAGGILIEEAEWLIENYEPRFETTDISTSALLEENLSIEKINLTGNISE